MTHETRARDVVQAVSRLFDAKMELWEHQHAIAKNQPEIGNAEIKVRSAEDELDAAVQEATLPRFG